MNPDNLTALDEARKVLEDGARENGKEAVQEYNAAQREFDAAKDRYDAAKGRLRNAETALRTHLYDNGPVVMFKDSGPDDSAVVFYRYSSGDIVQHDATLLDGFLND